VAAQCRPRFPRHRGNHRAGTVPNTSIEIDVLIPSCQVFFAFRLYIVSQNIWVAIPAWSLSFLRFVFLVWWLSRFCVFASAHGRL
jgi:hypothetical protein